MPVQSFHIKGKHVIGLKLEAMFPFSLSLRINVVLPIVNHSRIWHVVKQSCSCNAIRSVHDVKLFNQNPCKPSESGAFQFALSFVLSILPM